MNTSDFMHKEIGQRNPVKWEEKLHATKAEQARRNQIDTFNEELQFSDRIPSSPRAFKKERITAREVVRQIINTVNPVRFLP